MSIKPEYYSTMGQFLTPVDSVFSFLIQANNRPLNLGSFSLYDSSFPSGSDMLN